MNASPVVVVTGSSAGLGRSIAHAFAKRDAKLGLLARNPEALDAAKRECESLGGEAIFIPTDVSDADAVERAANQVEEHFGPIDIWVNDAMVSVFSPVKEMEASDYKRVTDVLYLGFVHGTLSALRRMLPRNRGTIIQIGSALSYRSIPLQSAYCACKHAINGFTDSLRCELRHDNSNVKVTAVHMPAMNTTQFNWVKNRMPHNTQPVPPIFEPEICAEVVVAAGMAREPSSRVLGREHQRSRRSSRSELFLACSIGTSARPVTNRSNCKTSRAIRMGRTTCMTMSPAYIARGASSMTAPSKQALRFFFHCTVDG